MRFSTYGINIILMKSPELRFHLNGICCHDRFGLQAVDVSGEVLLAIAFVKVAETAKHKLGFLE
jgi:hypothetical protein